MILEMLFEFVHVFSDSDFISGMHALVEVILD